MPGTASSKPLVPGQPTRLLLCRYHGLNGNPRLLIAGTRKITQGATIIRLAQQFNALPDQGPGIGPGATACPADDASRIVAFFASKHAADDPVHVQLWGCRVVSTSQVLRSAIYAPGERLIRKLDVLTGCPRHRIPCA